MRSLVTPQQAAFFTQNGYIELADIPFDPEAIFKEARIALMTRPLGRDLWRKQEALKLFLIKTLASISLSLAGKSLRLACDQWIPPHFGASHAPSCIKDFFSIQGLALIAILSSSTVPTPSRRPAALGIPPFPTRLDNILFVKPHIVLDWPLLQTRELYVAAYAFSQNGVYIYNPKDKATHSLKELGYEFGDALKESFHPMIGRRT